MGLFSSKNKVYVSSSVWNLAGEVSDRPNLLKSVVAEHMLAANSVKRSLPEALFQSQIKGPGIQQRNFFRWSQIHFPIGLPAASLSGGIDIGEVDFTPYLPAGALVGSYSAETADFFYWAEALIFEEYPERIGTDWTADMLPGGSVRIQFEDLSTLDFSPLGYDVEETYVYVYWNDMGGDGAPRLWIYRLGSGTHPKLDALKKGADKLGDFYPTIPLRLDNKSIRHETFSNDFDEIATAYRKATGKGDIDDLLDQIEENPDLGDIDFCYMVYGVPLNTKDSASRKYLYEFFRRLMRSQTASPASFANWKAKPGYKPHPRLSSIRMNCDDPLMRYFDMRLSWAVIDEEFFSGLGKPDAKQGELWFGAPGSYEWQSILYSFEHHEAGTITHYDDHSMKSVELFWQTGPNAYRKLTIWGMIHRNFVYDGKSVDINTTSALADEEESGFIIPLHYPTLKKLPLKDANQLSVSNALLVFNCYEVVKVKWYQRGFFKVIIAVVAVVVAAVINPGLLAAAPGLLGTNLAVGAALGLTGLSAIIAGAVANTIAATLLVSMIQKGAVAVFGDKFGAVIGAIASFVALNVGTAWASSGSFAINWSQFARPEMLLRMTEAGAAAYTGWARAEMAGIQADMIGLEDQYQDDLDEIEKLSAELLGYGGTVIDPLQFTHIPDSSVKPAESRDTFLSRTLLTGSDIADLNRVMIDSFAELSLELPKPIL